MNPEGIITRESKYPAKETMDRLQKFLQDHSVTVYARIDQQAEAKKAGIDILPIQFILFGNPKAGGPLMQTNPLIALDLPLKIIVWEDNTGKVWLSYNDGGFIEQRYGLEHNPASPIHLDGLINKVLNG